MVSPPPMSVRLSALVVVVCGLGAACGGQKPSPPSTGPGDGVIQLTGGERLAWDQRASSAAELAAIRFLLYVDGASLDFSGTSCGELSGDQALCSGPIPSLSIGEHTLELSANSPNGTESTRSAPLRVSVLRTASLGMPAGHASPPASAPPPVASFVAAGVTLHEVVSGLDDPTDLAVGSDGRVFIAERAGRLRVLEAGFLLEPPALVLDDVSGSPGASGLLSVVLDPDFTRTRFVYAVYTTKDGFRLSRFREVGGTLGERVVLLDGVPAAGTPAAALRFGPDGKLYVAFDDGGDPDRALDFGSYNGKLLRLNADGTVPHDQAGLTPVFALNLGATRGFDWDLEAKTLWLAEGIEGRRGLLSAVVDEGTERRRRARIVERYALPDEAVPSSVLLYRHQLMPHWRGDLLVALPASQELLRLGLASDGSGRVTRSEVVLTGRAGRVRALGVTPHGVIYLVNDTSVLALTSADDPQGL